MSNVFFYVILVALCAAMMATVAVWHTRRVFARISALLLFVLVCGGTMILPTVSLGVPKPAQLEVVKVTKATIIAARLREGVAMYVLMMLPGNDEPRYYRLPWDQDMAQQLQKALEQAGEDGTVEMSNPFESTWDKKDPKFYPKPQPKMPDKPQQSEPRGQTYRQQEL